MYGDWLNGDPQARYHKLYTLNLQTAGRGFVEIVINSDFLYFVLLVLTYGNELVKLVCLLDLGKDGIISRKVWF